jgi:hypothetical protein
MTTQMSLNSLVRKSALHFLHVIRKLQQILNIVAVGYDINLL